MYSFDSGGLVAVVVMCFMVGMVGRWVVMGELPVIWAALKALVGRRGEKDMYSFRNGELIALVLVFVLLGIVAGWAFREGLPLLWEVVKPWIHEVTR
ncbi:hypothetical protein [Methyloversatilis discipulorum]|uniref:hypothetical protein n=1 Tax=Methyloversatilis discipulorum TaxID=1119528 RepID=UPI000378AF30|nr:hypothetical protein [Methyloversatilis discipulorum]